MKAKHLPSNREHRCLPAARRALLKTAIAATLFSCGTMLVCAELRQPSLAPADSNDAKLLEEYVKAKGASIVFDAANIKQFWIERSVSAQNGNVCIYLDPSASGGFDSVPLKVQLMNVNEALDCKVEVIADSPDFSFTVANSKNKTLSASAADQQFIQYHAASATFHLEDTPDYSFRLKFSSKALDSLSVKKILLSFSNNKNSTYLASPGKLKVGSDNVSFSGPLSKEDNAFKITGKQSTLFLKNNILASGTDIETSVKVKNVGDKPTRVYVGFAAYTKNKVRLDGKNYPYKNLNKVLTVVSSEAGSDKIVVDSYSEWAKNCHLALNAEDDMADIPNVTIADGRIVDVKKLDDGKAEITVDKPFKTALEAGTKIRIQGQGGAYLYTNNKVLQPGEEAVFTSSVKKDDSFLEYSTKAFSRGVHYVRPLIFSYSTDSKEENTVEISDYTISY